MPNVALCLFSASCKLALSDAGNNFTKDSFTGHFFLGYDSALICWNTLLNATIEAKGYFILQMLIYYLLKENRWRYRVKWGKNKFEVSEKMDSTLTWPPIMILNISSLDQVEYAFLWLRLLNQNRKYYTFWQLLFIQWMHLLSFFVYK